MKEAHSTQEDAIKDIVAELTSEQQQYARVIKKTMVTIVKNHIKLGEQLINAKKHLPHGHFIPMIESIGLHYENAKKIMQIPKLAIVQSNRENFTLLGFNNTQLKKLDKMEDEEAQEVMDSGNFPKDKKEEVPRVSTPKVPTKKPTKEKEKIIEAKIIGEEEKYDALKEEVKALKSKNSDLSKMYNSLIGKVAKYDALLAENKALKAENKKLNREEEATPHTLSEKTMTEAIVLAGSQRKLADATGASQSVIAKLKLGKANNTDTYRKAVKTISEYLG